MGIECAKAGGRARWGRTAHNSMWRRFESYLETLAVLLLAWIMLLPATCRWLAVTPIPPDLCTIHTAYDPLFCGLTRPRSPISRSKACLSTADTTPTTEAPPRVAWGRSASTSSTPRCVSLRAGRTYRRRVAHKLRRVVTVFGTGREGCTHIHSYLAHGIRPSPVGVLSHQEGRPLLFDRDERVD